MLVEAVYEEPQGADMGLEREAADAGAPPADAPRLAVALKSPPVVVRRRCVSWVEVDGGADGGR